MGEAPARCNGEARSRGPSNPGSLRYSWLLTRTKLTLQKMTPPVSAGHSQGRVLTVPNKERKGEADALSPSEPEPGPVGFPTGQADRGECQRQSLVLSLRVCPFLRKPLSPGLQAERTLSLLPLTKILPGTQASF